MTSQTAGARQKDSLSLIVSLIETKSSARVKSAQMLNTESGTFAKDSHSDRTAASSALLRATTQTFAPRSAYLWAIERPIPLEAPRTKTRSVPGGTSLGLLDRRLENRLGINWHGTMMTRATKVAIPMWYTIPIVKRRVQPQLRKLEGGFQVVRRRYNSNSDISVARRFILFYLFLNDKTRCYRVIF
jgi:hypothetical protein